METMPMSLAPAASLWPGALARGLFSPLGPGASTCLYVLFLYRTLGSSREVIHLPHVRACTGTCAPAHMLG